MSKSKKTNTSQIEQAVMDKIKSGKVQMRSHYYFMAIGGLGILATTLLGLVAIYFISVASLWLRIMYADGPAFGAKRNLNYMLDTLPWWALILGVLALICVVFLMKKFGRVYKVRLAYLLALVLVLFATIGFVLSYSNLPGLMGGDHRFNNMKNMQDGDLKFRGPMNSHRNL